MILEQLQHATSSLLSRLVRVPSPTDRRSYGYDIRLWNDRDPRVDQSFFQGSVPGFVLGVDQSIVDWNIGFDLVFGHNSSLKRGSNVIDWYRLIQNFRRLPSREEKLHGEAVLPITDRERVVYESPIYGRMVFMKMMSPVLDRYTGRVIGWNIALNVNSVHERVKFFSDLNDRIQNASKHARYVISLDQLMSKSKQFSQAIARSVDFIRGDGDVLIVGASGAAPFVREILSINQTVKVSVIDHDTEALRHLRHKLSPFGSRVKLIRNSLENLAMPKTRFGSAMILWPTLDESALARITSRIEQGVSSGGRVAVISWLNEGSGGEFWDCVQRDLEEQRDIDAIRWHLGVVREESSRLGIQPLKRGREIFRGLGRYIHTVKSA